jgi:hypothetical protein
MDEFVCNAEIQQSSLLKLDAISLLSADKTAIKNFTLEVKESSTTYENLPAIPQKLGQLHGAPMGLRYCSA